MNSPSWSKGISLFGSFCRMIRPAGRTADTAGFRISDFVIHCGPLCGMKACDRCLGHRLVLFTAAAAHANSAHHLAAHLEWNAAREDHHSSAIPFMYP